MKLTTLLLYLASTVRSHTITPWYHYWNPASKTYRVPVAVDYSTYNLEDIPILEQNLQWVKNHLQENSNIELDIAKNKKSHNSHDHDSIKQGGFIKIINHEDDHGSYDDGCSSFLGNAYQFFKTKGQKTNTRLQFVFQLTNVLNQILLEHLQKMS